MSKTKEVEITPALLADVSTVLEMAKKNKYSVSKVYAAYNAVTGKNDPPQTCNSCVRNRVAALRKWHAEYVERTSKLMEPAPTANLEAFDLHEHDRIVGEAGQFFQPDPIGTPDEPTPPSEDERPDVIRLAVPGWESALYFKPGDKDPSKGVVTYEVGGGAVKPGKYTLTDGRELAVQPGGKATIKAAPAYNDLL